MVVSSLDGFVYLVYVLNFDLVVFWIVFVLVVVLFLVVYFGFVCPGVWLLGIVCLLLVVWVEFGLLTVSF